VAALGIQVRAGLHTGEVERTEADVLGVAVHLTSRIMDTAGPGEVVISRTVKELVAGSGIEFESTGEHSLKGMDEKWRSEQRADRLNTNVAFWPIAEVVPLRTGARFPGQSGLPQMNSKSEGVAQAPSREPTVS
jgi:hypothetical protein